MGIHLTAEGESIIGLTSDTAFQESSSIKLPEESKVLAGEDAAEQWEASIDPDIFLDHLEKAGLPRELLESFFFAPEEAA